MAIAYGLYRYVCCVLLLNKGTTFGGQFPL